MLLASTALTFFPTTSRSRSRRRTSTSGNSSTVVSPRQRVPRRLRRCLLGSLLRRAHPRAERVVIDHDRGVEAFAVLGTGLGQHVPRRPFESVRGQLLQASLVVVPAGPDRRLFDVSAEQLHDGTGGGGVSGVEVEGADDGLEGIRE